MKGQFCRVNLLLPLGTMASVSLYTDNQISTHVLSVQRCTVLHMHSTNAHYKCCNDDDDDDDDNNIEPKWQVTQCSLPEKGRFYKFYRKLTIAVQGTKTSVIHTSQAS